MNTKTALVIVSEIGPSVDGWVNAKHFTSWLGLSPNNRISGGKRLSGKTHAGSNRVKQALRMAAMTLERSATARKLAVLVYNLIKNKTSYQEKGPLYFEKAYREQTERRLKRLAEQLGYNLTPKDHET